MSRDGYWQRVLLQVTLPTMTTAALAAILLTSLPASQAATIESVGTFSLPGFSTGTMGPVGNTPAPNNDDDPAASPNVIPYSVFLNSPGFLETEFELEDSGGTTEYRFTQTFFNTRNFQWTGVRFELGFGTGDSFVSADPGGILRFDTLNGQSTATSPVFTLQSAQPARLDWSIVNVPLMSPFTFAIDVPDGLTTFTLRQTPVTASPVPEPGALAPLGVALLGMVVWRRSAGRAK